MIHLVNRQRHQRYSFRYPVLDSRWQVKNKKGEPGPGKMIIQALNPLNIEFQF